MSVKLSSYYFVVLGTVLFFFREQNSPGIILWSEIEFFTKHCNPAPCVSKFPDMEKTKYLDKIYNGTKQNKATKTNKKTNKTTEEQSEQYVRNATYVS